MHKFSPACIHLDAKYYKCDHGLCLLLSSYITGHLTGCGDTDQHNQSFFLHKTKNCTILAITQAATLQPKSKNSEEIGYFEEVYLLKPRRNNSSLYVTNF